MSAARARPVQAGLLGLTVLALAGVIIAAVEGRAGWVYVAVGLFMAAGVALAVHTALVANRPQVVMRNAGFLPARASHVWRAVVDGVPIEARLEHGSARFRAEAIPDGLAIAPGSGGVPTGDPAFDGIVRCTGRRAWIAALGPELRARLEPLLALGGRVIGGVLVVPMGGVDLVTAAAQAAARLGRVHADLRAALVARLDDDPPAKGGLHAFAALAAGWPEHRDTVARGERLLAHPDPVTRLTVAEAWAGRARTELAALAADATLDPALRIRAFRAHVGATSGALRRKVLRAGLAEPCFVDAAHALARTHGVRLEGET